VNPTLVRLTLLSIRGRFKRWLRLMRQPKYLAGFLIGAAYLVFVFSRAFRDDDDRFVLRGWQTELTADLGPLIELGASLAVAFALSIAWLLPWGRLGLRLKEAELHLLLPAPVTRREIIQYAALKGQRGILISALIISFFAGTGELGDQLRMVVAVWLLFTLWDLNNRCRSMFLIRQRELPVERARMRRLVLTLVIVSFWGVLSAVLLPRWAPLQPLAVAGTIELGDLANAATDTLGGVAGWLLAPFRWALGPAFADATGAFLIALLPPLVMLVAQHELLMRAPARFEEEALQHARHDARKRTRSFRFEKMSSSSRRRVPFRLAHTGGAEIALLWKNLLQLGRFPVRGWLFIALGALIGVAIAPTLGAPPAFSAIGLVVGFIMAIGFPLIGPMSLRNDMRTELGHIDLVRTWPVSRARFVLGQVLGPAAVATAGGVFGLCLTVAAVAGPRLRTLVTGTEATNAPVLSEASEILGAPGLIAALFLLVGASPLIASVSLLSSSLQNCVTLTFPAWVRLGADQSRGVEAMGQRILFATVIFVALLVVVIPGGLLIAIAAAVQGMLNIPWGVWDLLLWGLLASTPAFGAALIVVRVGAGQWASMDPSQEILESAR
jgi:hypothetical protein